MSLVDSTVCRRLAPVVALLGALALGGCSPEGKGKVKLGDRSEVDKRIGAPPGKPAAKAGGSAPKNDPNSQFRSMKSRGTTE